MKRLLTCLSFYLFIAFSAYADKQEPVTLNSSHPKEIIKRDYCNIIVSKSDIEGDGIAHVTVTIENIQKKEVLILFGIASSEKALRSYSPSIRFDKHFGGDKGKREVENYQPIGKTPIWIEPEREHSLPLIRIADGEVKTFRLPLYIATKSKSFFGGNKLVLLEKRIIELEIKAETRPDEDYIRIEKETDELIDEIKKQTFCPNPKHKPSLEEQKMPYQKRIDEIKAEIKNTKEQHGWFETSPGYQKYKDVKEKLETVNLSDYEHDCGKKHGVTLPSCKYCNLSPQQVYDKLDYFNKKIYSSSNRKAAKNEVMADVNLLYNCRKHSSSWKNSEYKSKITVLYNEISKY